MKTKNWYLAIRKAVIWYSFIYYLLYAIKNSVELWQAALILLALAYLGTITCPLIEAWKRMWRK